MNRKRKYRYFLIVFLCLDLILIAALSYRYMNRKIPDEIHVSDNQKEQVQKLLKHPLLTFDRSIAVSGDGSYLLHSRILGVVPFKDIKVIPEDEKSVYVSGNTVGIYMETEGVLVIDTGEILSEKGTKESPSENRAKPGDYIVAFNCQTVSTKKELMADLRETDGQKITLEVMRNGEKVPLTIEPVKDATGNYRLGIWVRDNTQGIGTLTYVDEEGRFGALGHGISDVDTGSLLHIASGSLYQAEILGIQKGISGSPGELSGLIRYETTKKAGFIKKNSEKGIYGQFTGSSDKFNLKKMQVAYKQELETGPASVLCCVEGEVKEYDAEITKIDMNHEDSNKSFVIEITDPALLEATGGIIQGMSGSPVIQNGKFAGAVTHVFVQDAAGGYGIFAETMLENEEG